MDRSAYCRATLRKRALDGGGFPLYPGQAFRPDATAWAVLALAVTKARKDEYRMIEAGRSRLAGSQSRDGRVSMSPDDTGSYWPTPLAILAWCDSETYAGQRLRAIRFLLETSGETWAKDKNSPFGHDTSIPGWSWTLGAHPWVEPTALSVIALRLSGFADHVRVHEGVRMLMDRQLPTGGWNYGNTSVYGTQLLPQPDCTGLALSALTGCVPLSDVEKSLDYLVSRAVRVRTPLSLGWGILGLSAWGRKPDQTAAWIRECVDAEEVRGTYDTTLVSLLLLALHAKEGLGSLSA